MMDTSPAACVTLREMKNLLSGNFHNGIIRIKESRSANCRESMHFIKALTEFLQHNRTGKKRAGRTARCVIWCCPVRNRALLCMLGLDEQQEGASHQGSGFPCSSIVSVDEPAAAGSCVYACRENAAELVLLTVLLYEQLLHLDLCQGN